MSPWEPKHPHNKVWREYTAALLDGNPVNVECRSAIAALGWQISDNPEWLADLEYRIMPTLTPVRPPMPQWMSYNADTDVLTICGKRYARMLFEKPGGLLGPPGTILRVESTPDSDLVVVTNLTKAVQALCNHL